MCGIFGATSFERFEKLYVKNKERGNFASGFMYLKRNGSMYIKKDQGANSLASHYAWGYQRQYDIFLGHTQAPTSSNRDYNVETTHPFDDRNFVVAHNGVLENHYALADQYNIPHNSIKVDTQIIPALLNELYVGSDVYALKEVCSLLKGIFACWIFCKDTKLSYVVRSGSTLYTNKNKTMFSSIPLEDVDTEVKEGEINCMTVEGLTTVGNFEVNNSFFI